jgi:hypothetical protein
VAAEAGHGKDWVRAGVELRSGSRDADGWLGAAGCEIIRKEKASGKTRDGRDELAAILGFIRPGDEPVVVKLDRLDGSTRDVLKRGRPPPRPPDALQLDRRWACGTCRSELRSFASILWRRKGFCMCEVSHILIVVVRAD